MAKYTLQGWGDGTGMTTYPGLKNMDEQLLRVSNVNVSAADFGVIGDGSNESSNLQTAIDTLAAEGGGQLHFDNKTYIVHDIVLKGEVSLYGAGSYNTIFKPPAGSTATAVFTHAAGPQNRITLKNFTVEENGNAGQHGLYFYAQPRAISPFDGGIWWPYLEDVEVRFFSGHQIWFRGGSTDFLIPQQMMILNNVRALRANNTTSRCILSTGQVGQVTVIGGEFDGAAGAYTGTNIEISQEYQNGATIGGMSVGGSTTGSIFPYSWQFLGSTIQDANKGVLIDRGFDINFFAAHWENTFYALDVHNDSRSVSVIGGLAADAAQDGSGTGYFVRSNSNSRVMCSGTVVYGAVDRIGVRTTGGQLDLGIMPSNNMDTTLVTSGLTSTPTAAATLALGAQRTAVITSSGTTVTTINSSLSPGSLLHLTSSGGSVSYGTGGNLTLGGRTSPVAVATGACATFVRLDASGFTWQLVSVSN